jgi:HEAT repeat protein
MTLRFRWFSKLAMVGSCFALSCVVLAGQKSQPSNLTSAHSDSTHTQVAISQLQQVAESPREQVTEIPTDVDAPVAKNSLVLAFRNRSALRRAELLERVDSSPAFDEPAAVSLLQDALHDEDPLVREAALRALIRRDSEESPVLTEADAASFQGENAELAKVHFAAKNGDSATLRELIQSGDAVVQESAFEALATTDLPGAVGVLRTELRDEKSLYRLQTLELFTRSSYTNSRDQLLPVLREMVEDQDPLVREYANQKLKEKELEADGEQQP